MCYWVTGVVQAEGLKVLWGGGSPQHSVLAWPEECGHPADGQLLSCHGFPRP